MSSHDPVVKSFTCDSDPYVIDVNMAKLIRQENICDIQSITITPTRALKSHGNTDVLVVVAFKKWVNV